MKNLLLALILITLNSCQSEKGTNLKTHEILPSYFDNGDRIFLKIPTVNGDTITVFTDTGGGFTAVYPNALTKTKLENRIRQILIDGEMENVIDAKDIIKDQKYYPFLTQGLKEITNTPFFLCSLGRICFAKRKRTF